MALEGLAWRWCPVLLGRWVGGGRRAVRAPGPWVCAPHASSAAGTLACSLACPAPAHGSLSACARARPRLRCCPRPGTSLPQRARPCRMRLAGAAAGATARPWQPRRTRMQVRIEVRSPRTHDKNNTHASVSPRLTCLENCVLCAKKQKCLWQPYSAVNRARE